MSHPAWSHGGVKATISSRHGLNPDHNLWNNHGTWWAHFTVHHPNYTKERVRVSLGTKDIMEARRRRDLIMSGTSAIVARLPRLRSPVAPPPETACLTAQNAPLATPAGRHFDRSPAPLASRK